MGSGKRLFKDSPAPSHIPRKWLGMHSSDCRRSKCCTRKHRPPPSFILFPPENAIVCTPFSFLLSPETTFV